MSLIRKKSDKSIEKIRTNKDKEQLHTVANTAPESPVEGQQWFDSANNNFKIYDGASWNIISQTGPTGPTGAQGVQGATGPTGPTGAAGSFGRRLFYAYDAVGGIGLTSSWTPITLDTEVKEDSDFTHAADSSEIQFNDSKWYDITYYVSIIHSEAAGALEEAEFRLEEDTGSGYTAINGTNSLLIHNTQNVARGMNSSVTILRQLSNTNKIRLVGRKNGTYDVETFANSCGIVIRDAAASGAIGPTGPTGPSGGPTGPTGPTGSVGVTSSIQDLDGDTKVQVEKNADEDIIRFNIGGSEVGQLNSNATIINATTATMIRYVDYTNGTDDTSHGTGTGSNAWKTIGYAISQIPKYLVHDVTINVADDVYSISSAIIIEGFVGSGMLYIHGGDATPADGSYDIDTGANGCHGFEINDCSAYIFIGGFYIDADAQTNRGIVVSHSQFAELRNVRVHNFDIGFYVEGSTIYAINSDLDDNNNGIASRLMGQAHSRSNASSTINDEYGLTAGTGGVIAKYDATQPSGTVDNESATTGGVIR